MGKAKRILAVVLPLLAFGKSGYATNVPERSAPVQTAHTGSPGHLQQGDTEFGGAMMVDILGEPHGGLQLDHAATDKIAIELGVDTGPNWAMGRVGLRITPLTVKNRTNQLTYDFTIGGGLGVGGVRSCEVDWWGGYDDSDCDAYDSFEHIAYGIYAGAGVGHRWRKFTLFFRAHVELTKSDELPATFWNSLDLGFHWTFAERAQLFFTLGEIGYVNAQYWGMSPSIMLGFSYVWSSASAPAKQAAVPVAWL